MSTKLSLNKIQMSEHRPTLKADNIQEEVIMETLGSDNENVDKTKEIGDTSQINEAESILPKETDVPVSNEVEQNRENFWTRNPHADKDYKLILPLFQNAKALQIDIAKFDALKNSTEKQ